MSLDKMIDEALTVKPSGFLELINQVNEILSTERGKGENASRIVGRLIYIPPSGEAIVVGDIHGDLQSLKHILHETRFIERALDKRNIYLIFLGDYGDRGVYSPEVYYVVLTLKRMFPEKVILLQGNHEGPEDLLAYPHDLPYHLRRKFGSEGPEIYRELSALFRQFYTAVLVEVRYVMLHGGVPSEVKNLGDVAFAYEKHPIESHLEEILWSDPIDGLSGKSPSPRGAGYLFGEDITRRFLNIAGARFLIRGHEPAVNGYKFNHGGRVLTLFSRKGPPYYNVHGAYLSLNLSIDLNSAAEIEDFIRRF
jgi:protein phosphatase